MSDQDFETFAENNNITKQQLHQVRIPVTPISSLQQPTGSATADRIRPKIVRRPRGSINGGLGTSLSNLSSVSEAPLTASAVSYKKQTLQPQDQQCRPPVRRGSGDHSPHRCIFKEFCSFLKKNQPSQLSVFRPGIFWNYLNLITLSYFRRIYC